MRGECLDFAWHERIDKTMPDLVPHPDYPPKSVTSVRVEIIATVDDILLTYVVDGKGSVLIPNWTHSARKDSLWATTCCEIFLKLKGGDTYFEFNFSPSSEWAAYQFAHYRDGMRDLDMVVEPHIQRGLEEDNFLVEVDLDISDIPQGELKVALSAVIEETDGTKSYWALQHPPGPPDFHHPDCFALTLAAPSDA